jgi:hypothetical protein
MSIRLRFNPILNVGRTTNACNLRFISVFLPAKQPLRCLETRLVVKDG